VTEAAFKQWLAALAGQDFELSAGDDAYAILDQHLDCLGSLDPELRDGLFYEAADTWIGRGLLAHGQAVRLTTRLLSGGFLFRGIGNQEGTEVFRRTFTLLILDSLVRRATVEDCRDAAWVETIAFAMVRYAAEEQDLRGFVPSCGWAHAAAHAADVLASLMASPALANWEGRLLEAARQLLLRNPGVYTHQEDKRLARVLLSHRRHHAERLDEFQAWIEGLLLTCPPAFADMEAYARRTNALDLLRALYFYLHREPQEAVTAAWVESRIRDLMRIA